MSVVSDYIARLLASVKKRGIYVEIEWPTGALARQLFEEEEDIHDSPGEVEGEIHNAVEYAEEEEPDNQEDVN